MEVKLNDDQLNQAMQSAILAAIGDTGREQIIKSAIEHLTKKSDGYNGRSNPSPLEQIMQNSAENIARAVMASKFENDAEFKQQIESMYSEAFQRVFTGEGRDKVVERMASKMAEVLQSDRY